MPEIKLTVTTSQLERIRNAVREWVGENDTRTDIEILKVFIKDRLRRVVIENEEREAINNVSSF